MQPQATQTASIHTESQSSLLDMEDSDAEEEHAPAINDLSGQGTEPEAAVVMFQPVVHRNKKKMMKMSINIATTALKACVSVDGFI